MVIQNFCHKRVAPCHEHVAKLSTEHCKRLHDFSRFHAVEAVTNLPPTVIVLCARSKDGLAEPGHEWEATDVIMDSMLPTKRLIWAVVGGEYYVVHYERGGRGHTFHVLVATFKQGDPEAKVIWRGVGGHFEDFKSFFEALKLESNSEFY